MAGETAAPTAVGEVGIGPSLAIACIVIVALDLRPGLVSIGPILPAIRAEFALSHTAAALLTSIPDLLLGVLALPTPWLVRNFGRDRTVIGALVLLGAAMVLRALAPGAVWLLLATAGVGGGIAVAGTLVGVFIKAAFPRRAALMMGIYAMALSAGSTLAAGLTGPITLAFGSWRAGAGAWAVLGLGAIAAWRLIARRAAKGATTAGPSPRRPLPWTNGLAWRVALYFGGLNLLFYALIAWLAPIYQERGLSATRAGLLLAAFTLVFTFATLAFGLLSKSTDRRFWLALAAGLGGVGIGGLALAPTAAPFAFAAVAACGLGGAFTLAMTLPLDNTETADEATAWNAFVMLIGYVIASVGPLSVGVLRDLCGGFSPALYMLLAVSLSMLALSPFLRPRASMAPAASLATHLAGGQARQQPPVE